MVLSRVRLIRVKLVLVNLNPINDTYIFVFRLKLGSLSSHFFGQANLFEYFNSQAVRLPSMTR